jgi:hypothetical protein
MEDNETKTSTTHTKNDLIVIGTSAFGAGMIARLGYIGMREGVRYVKSHKKNKSDN